MIDDMAEIQFVDRCLRGAVVAAVNTNPYRMPGLKTDARRARPERPGQQRVQPGRALARLLDPAKSLFPSVGPGDFRRGRNDRGGGVSVKHRRRPRWSAWDTGRAAHD